MKDNIINNAFILSSDDDPNVVTFQQGSSELSLSTIRGELYKSKNKSNQDCIATGHIKAENNSELFLDLVCDGVGGYEDGAKAAQLFCKTLKLICQEGEVSSMTGEEILKQLISNALITYERDNLKYESGTTFLLALTRNQQLEIFHLGDSRALLFQTNGDFFMQSEDHKSGVFNERFLLTEYFHQTDEEYLLEKVGRTNIDLNDYPKGLVLILASDGVTDNLNVSVEDRECHPNISKLIKDNFSNHSTDILCSTIMSEANKNMSLQGTDEGEKLDVKPDNSACLVRRIGGQF